MKRSKGRVYALTLYERGVPGANNRLDRLPRVAKWQQLIRGAIYDAHGLINVGKRGGRIHLEAPFSLAPGERAEIEAWFYFKSKSSGDGVNLLKPVEDALFPEDRELLDGTYHVRRRQKENRVEIVLRIYPDAAGLQVRGPQTA